MSAQHQNNFHGILCDIFLTNSCLHIQSLTISTDVITQTVPLMLCHYLLLSPRACLTACQARLITPPCLSPLFAGTGPTFLCRQSVLSCALRLTLSPSLPTVSLKGKVCSWLRCRNNAHTVTGRDQNEGRGEFHRCVLATIVMIRKHRDRVFGFLSPQLLRHFNPLLPSKLFRLT